MHSTHSLITVTDLGPAKLIGRLAKHWSHKLEVEHDDTGARIEFGNATCVLRVQGDSIAATIESADGAELEKLEPVVAEHLQRMARGEALSIQWQRQG
ncbi:DUF2218 domain-containing protein [Lysobacter sp. A286]